MIQIRKEDNQKKQKEKKLKVYKVNTHKKTVIALWVLLAVSFLFAVYKNFTAIDIHTVHETKVIEETILDTHKISFAVAVTTRIPFSLILSSNVSSCLRCVSFSADLSGKKNWSTDIS